MKARSGRVTRKSPVKRSAVKRAVKRPVKRKKTSSGKVILAAVAVVVVIVGAVLLVRSLGGGGGIAGIGGKPTPLSENATKNQVADKADQILKYLDAHPNVDENGLIRIQANSLSLARIYKDDAWARQRSGTIKVVNDIIDKL